MFRAVDLPQSINGKLYLYRMPGRTGSLKEVFEQVEKLGLAEIISLAPMEEIRSKSPEYAEAISSQETPVNVTIVPVEDFGVPSDPDAFARAAESAAVSLRAGDRILVHCGAGIGRTGMFATLVLHYLGLGYEQSLETVEKAGSRPEKDGQVQFLRSMIKGG